MMAAPAKSPPPPPPPPPLTAVRCVCERNVACSIPSESLVTSLLSQFLVPSITWSSFARAATLGSTRLLAHLVHEAQVQRIDAFLLEHWLTKAAKASAWLGHRGLCRWILTFSNECASPFWWNCIEVVAAGAMAGGRLNLLKEMAALMGATRGRNVLLGLSIASGDACVNDVETLQWLGAQNIPLSLAYSIRGGDQDGALAGIEWLHSIGAEGMDRGELIRAAASHGYERVVRFLVEEVGSSIDQSVLSQCGARRDSTRLMQYLMDRAPSECQYPVLRRVVKRGGIENAKLLLAKYPALWRQCEQNGSLLGCAVASGRIAVVHWVRTYHRQHHGSDGPLSITTNLIQAAAGHGHLQMVQWLHNHAQPDWNGAWPRSEADEDENVVDLKEVRRLEGYTADEHPDDASKAIRRGQVEVLRWLVANRPGGFRAKINMCTATRFGSLEVFQTLAGHVEMQLDEYTMPYAVEAGDLELVIWLHRHRRDGCGLDISTLTPVPLALAKWLLANVATTADEKEGLVQRVLHSQSLGLFGALEWMSEHQLLISGPLREMLLLHTGMGDLYFLQWVAARAPELVDWDALQMRAEVTGQSHVVAWLATAERG